MKETRREIPESILTIDATSPLIIYNTEAWDLNPSKL
jgi:hypothetical protein